MREFVKSAKGADARHESREETRGSLRGALDTVHVLRVLLKAAALLVLASGILCLKAEPAPAEIDRLVTVGKLWATIKYFHPYFAYRKIDWDKSLVDALPAIRKAGNAAEYAAAIESMLNTLHDPSTYVGKSVSGKPAGLRFEKRQDGTLIVSQDAAKAASDNTAALLRNMQGTQNLVFDLRGSSDELSELLDEPQIQKELASESVETLGRRSLVYTGLPSASGINAGEFKTAFSVLPGVPIKGDFRSSRRKYSFVAGEGSLIPSVAQALVARQQASIVSESAHYRLAPASEIVTLPLEFGLEANVSLCEPVMPNGRGMFTIPVVSGERAVSEAIASLTKEDYNAAGNSLPFVPRVAADRDYAESPFPTEDLRILTAFKIWEVFRTFYAYREQIDEDWDDTFKKFLPKLLAVSSAREYHLAVAELITQINDAQAKVESEELVNYFGKAPVGLRVRLVDKQLVITEVLDSAAKGTGAHAGDIVKSIDGEVIAARLNREAHYVPASTRQGLEYAVSQSVLNGADGSTADLTIADTDGKESKIQLKRNVSFCSQLRNQRRGEIIRVLSGNIGYVDLDRLERGEVDSMFERLQHTRAIVFDMRGSPRGTAALIASRLSKNSDTPVAISTMALALRPDLPDDGVLTQSANQLLVRGLPPATKPHYTGKTVMLIDERTIGEGERAGLFFEAANKTEFIGTVSAGACGDVSDFVVPGGITIRFPAEDVRHGNGGQLQRLGLQPSMSVPPTLKAIREGRDETLEKAVETSFGKLTK